MGLLKLSEMLGSVSEACKAIERMDSQLKRKTGLATAVFQFRIIWILPRSNTRKSRRTFVPKGKLLRCLGEVSLLSSEAVNTNSDRRQSNLR
jgi:hypothetical protein